MGLVFFLGIVGPTSRQIEALLLFGLSLLIGTALYCGLLPAVRAGRNRFAVLLLREIADNRKGTCEVPAGLRRFWIAEA